MISKQAGPIRNRSLPGWSLLVLYVAFAVGPLLTAAWTAPATVHNSFYELGRSAALLGFTLLFLQVFLSGRFAWIERPFGLDILLRFHRSMGILALTLLAVHPVLLAFGGRGAGLIVGSQQPWFIWLGRITILTLLAHVALSVFRKLLQLPFEQWRRIHDGLALTVLSLAFIHSWNAGEDLETTALKLWWIGLAAAAFTAYLIHRLVRPWRLSRIPYQVAEVKAEARGVHSVSLTPAEGRQRFDFLPGQFHFLTLKRKRGLPTEEHHFTISSSPTEPNALTSTIKASGDFTGAIADTRPGDIAIVQGPFGRFSYLLHPQESDLVFCAAGIGITPLMSMLRHMRDTGANQRVLLLYGNKTEEDIVFREELAAMENGARKWLRVVHILSRADESWRGPRGRIDQEKIERYCGQRFGAAAFYVCGPEPMSKQVASALRALGVARRRIRAEAFSLVEAHSPGYRDFQLKIVTAGVMTLTLAMAGLTGWFRGTGF